ncbi:MAG: MotA/TolQ/ExbB proton channel family protein [Burkholderiaceae bacterium]
MLNLNRVRALAAALLIAATPLAATLAPVAAHAQATPTAQAAVTGTSAAEQAPVFPPASKKEVVDNPYGLDALWKNGDLVAKSTLFILLAMSIGSWYIIFTKLFDQSKLARQGVKANQTFWNEGKVDQAIQTLEKKSAFHFVAKSGVDATEHHKGILGHVDFNTWVTLSIQRAIEKVQSRLQNGLAFLATVGSTAPFVGLFGTVWGIYHALTAIGIAGQASIDKVAGPVGESLIMTALGLFVAVPAVLGYNWLVRRNKAVVDDVRAFGADLHAVLLGEAAARANETPVKHNLRAIAV